MQQLLAERCQGSVTTCSQMAAQSRAARAAELAALSNRFKNGILHDDASSSDEAVVSAAHNFIHKLNLILLDHYSILI